MRQYNYFFRLFIFWLIYFFINRLFFISCFFDDFKDKLGSDFSNIILKSLRLDISFVSYLSVIILLLLVLKFLISLNRPILLIFDLIKYLNISFILLSAFIISGEISIYSEWGTKLNFKALKHFENPSEIFSTATLDNYFLVLLSFIVSIIFIKIYLNFVHHYILIFDKKENIFLKFTKTLFSVLVFIILIRGGIQEIPINTSDAYFSDKLIVNDVTVNPNWNFFQSIFKSKNNLNGNPYEKYSNAEAINFINSMHENNYDTSSILTNSKPNIIFILLESWSADNIESFGGLKGITPNFSQLCNQGLSFTNFYSNGWTSDQAMTSIFSSFPVFPYASIINQTDKSRKLPCLNKSLDSLGYNSSFFFGGQLTYGNIKGFLLSQSFDLVKDENNYSSLKSGRLGVHDEYMFSQFKKELSLLPQPFFSSLFTISSHSPYDFPAEHKLSFNSKQDKYVNSVAYTDKCLGDFIKSVKNEVWYENTLFVILADHSHKTPINRRVAQKEKFRIPMLWFGEVLNDKYVGKTCDTLSSQIDVTPTILSQLKISYKEYIFGANIFSRNSIGFVPYAFPKGYGLIRNSESYAFSEAYNRVLESDTISGSDIVKNTELFMQGAFNHFLAY